MGEVIPLRPRSRLDELSESILEMYDLRPLPVVELALVYDGTHVIYSDVNPEVAEELVELLRATRPERPYEVRVITLSLAEAARRSQPWRPDDAG